MRQIIQKIDSVFLGNVIHRLLRLYRTRVFKSSYNEAYRMVVYYDRFQNPLAELCDKYGSDKGSRTSSNHPYPWVAHTYADFYHTLFSYRRFEVSRVFECGIGTDNPDLASSMSATGKPGSSLRAWRDYFPKALVIGADIDKSILFEEERIKTCYVDQTKPETIKKMWEQIGGDEFELMIDDGLHTFESSVCLFENSVYKLAKGGFYVIEDVDKGDLIKYRRFFQSHSKYDVKFVSLYRPDCELANNNLVVVQVV